MRSENTQCLTVQEHRELSREVVAVTARMHELCDLVLEIYGPNNQAAFSFVKVAQELDRLCQDLQAQAKRDLPDVELNGIYQR